LSFDNRAGGGAVFAIELPLDTDAVAVPDTGVAVVPATAAGNAR